MAHFLARVYVSLKPTVNDPPGLTIADGLRSLGFAEVDGLERARARVASMCDRLLANPIIETSRFDVEEVLPAR
jgi:phosphoribosylformylglycinamidine (FGAM) synthase PurS component